MGDFLTSGAIFTLDMTRQKVSKRKIQKVPATVPGQALGYSLQFTRLTAILLEAQEGSCCSLEILDDVAETTIGGGKKLTQAKSALVQNPVSDHAVPLWKTLYNWLELIKGGFVTATNTIFEIYVSRPVTGELVDYFNRCTSTNEAESAVKRAQEILWGTAPNFDKRATLAKELSRYVNPVLEAEEKLLFPLIVNFRLQCGSGSPQEDIEAAIRRDPGSPARVFDIADKLCGWVKREVDKQLERGRAAIISRDEFHREYISYVRRVDRDVILAGFAGKPTSADKLDRLLDTFVRQFDLIDRSFDDKLAAISDFLRASYDRAMWSKAGEVHDESFVELDDQLSRTWNNLGLAVNVDAASKPKIQRGQLLYAKCMLYITRVQGMETPPYFIPGCFHRLADELVIGWHPDYRELLKSLTDEKL